MIAAVWMIAGSLFGIACGFAAIKRNRSAIPWWFAGVLLGPIGLGWLYAAGRRDGKDALL